MTQPRLIRPVRASLAATAIAGGCALLAGLTGCATPGSSTAAATRQAISLPTVAVSPPAVTVTPRAVMVAPTAVPSSANPASDPTPAAATPTSLSASAPTPTKPADPVVNAP